MRRFVREYRFAAREDEARMAALLLDQNRGGQQGKGAAGYGK